ncbi:hypothetical protein SPRG_03991 [Saprolegnia parasitica CBS 223.65]|uniref:Thioredoxin domain-containing protein n=1 Tax=Saprolegnia parasitica (strain CBS 223.65) TaxID=695850 RepID=A0A067CKY1_SAPPC|nr:hypothetical protein SPRG_03991 [Saprolegnia parasitica CBS 223.65]KDO31374.1 hypothetical protein SPRG_03991 [Saprolegnia parasitica CBS 223.65]|eukprot:XP_012197971.1 hypothetical protein SPRG_03991 [Saprolegnia parasitica CBS 223.65]
MLLLRAFLLAIAGVAASVHVLGDASFGAAVEDSSDAWLVDFYAPWCHSCQLLDPVLVDAADATDGLLRIGKVDVTVNPRLEAQFAIERYPTLLVRDPSGAWSPYKGERSVDAFLALGRRVSGTPVKTVATAADVDALLTTEASVLVFLHASDAVGAKLQPAYYSAATALRGQHLFLELRDSTSLASSPYFSTLPSTGSFVARVDATGDVALYDSTTLALKTWLQKHGHPKFVALGRENLMAIGKAHALLVVACVEDATDASFLHLVSKVASQTTADIAFGYLEATKVRAYLKRFYVATFPTYFVWNMHTNVFYEAPSGAITPESLHAHLARIASGAEKGIALGLTGYPYHAYRFVVDAGLDVVVGVALIVLAAAAAWHRARAKEDARMRAEALAAYERLKKEA